MWLLDVLKVGLDPKSDSSDLIKEMIKDKSQEEVNEMFDYFDKRLKESREKFCSKKSESTKEKESETDSLIKKLDALFGESHVKKVKSKEELMSVLDLLQEIVWDKKPTEFKSGEIPKEVIELFNNRVLYNEDDWEIVIVWDNSFLSSEWDADIHFIKDKSRLNKSLYSKAELKVWTYKDLKAWDVYFVEWAEVYLENLNVYSGVTEDIEWKDAIVVNYLSNHSKTWLDMLNNNIHTYKANKKLVIVKR